jgi:hypothetical protein
MVFKYSHNSHRLEGGATTSQQYIPWMFRQMDSCFLAELERDHHRRRRRDVPQAGQVGVVKAINSDLRNRSLGNGLNRR